MCLIVRMRPYRTQEEALDILRNKQGVRDYDDVLVNIPNKVVRDLIGLRLDRKYKRLMWRNEIELVNHIDWTKTQEGGKFWSQVVGWMAGINDLPELAGCGTIKGELV